MPGRGGEKVDDPEYGYCNVAPTQDYEKSGKNEIYDPEYGRCEVAEKVSDETRSPVKSWRGMSYPSGGVSELPSKILQFFFFLAVVSFGIWGLCHMRRFYKGHELREKQEKFHRDMDELDYRIWGKKKHDRGPRGGWFNGPWFGRKDFAV